MRRPSALWKSLANARCVRELSSRADGRGAGRKLQHFRIFHMATNKKIDRALNGPGPFEIILGILLSLTLGVVLAALHLVFKPVEVVTKPADATEVGVVYLVEGASSSSKARQWTRKRQMLSDGGPVEVVLVEEELNAWIAGAGPKPAGATPDKAAIIAPERINFRIQESLLQVGVVGKLTAFGIEHEMVVQTRGAFAPGQDGFVFEPKELFIGSLPAHMVPGLSGFFLKRLAASQELPEDIQAMWKKLTLVAVEGNTLRLTSP
jgi:hypothetical protein